LALFFFSSAFLATVSSSYQITHPPRS